MEPVKACTQHNRLHTYEIISDLNNSHAFNIQQLQQWQLKKIRSKTNAFGLLEIASQYNPDRKEEHTRQIDDMKTEVHKEANLRKVDDYGNP